MAERRERRIYSEEPKQQLVELFNHGKPQGEITQNEHQPFTVGTRAWLLR